MADLPVGAVYPTPEETHATMLSALRYAYGRRGVEINVKSGSELWERTWAVAQRVSLAIANGQVALRDTNPVDAQGDALLQWAAIYGVRGRPATGSTGFVIAIVNQPATTVPVPESFTATAPNGKKYDVTADTVVANGGLIEVRSVDTGEETDLPAGTILTWDSAEIAYLGIKCTVAAGGLDGGRSEDDIETVRARLLRKLSAPAVGGNWSHVATLAEDASAAVGFVAVYETMRGPSSYDVAIVGPPEDPVLNISTVNQVASAITAEMPGSASLNTTSTFLELIDVVINLGIPLPLHVGGAGGGWFDAEPWPSTNEALGVFARIINVVPSLNTIYVDSGAGDPPLPGKRFSIWNPDSLKMVNYAIESVSGVAGNWAIKIDSGFSTNLEFVAIGMYASAGAELLQVYATDFLAEMRKLGPGEKTDNPDLLQYAQRRPRPSVERPAKLTSLAISAVQSRHSEISDISYAARLDTGLTTTRTTPSIPSNTAAPPRQLALKNLSFRYQA